MCSINLGDKLASQQIKEGPGKQAWWNEEMRFEIERLKSILRDPGATDEEKAIAQSQMANYRENVRDGDAARRCSAPTDVPPGFVTRRRPFHMRIHTRTFSSEISVLADAEPYPGNAKGLQISFRKTADVTVVHIRGRATWGHSESLGEHLQELVANGARKLLLDLTCLTQVDSSGVSTIVKAFVSVRSKGGDLRLLRPRGRILEVFRLLCLQEIIACDEHECLALAKLADSASHAPLILSGELQPI